MKQNSLTGLAHIAARAILYLLLLLLVVVTKGVRFELAQDRVQQVITI